MSPTPDHRSQHQAERALPDSYRHQLEQGFEFGGVMTFSQRPLLTAPGELDRWQPDAALVGAPFDLGTTNRPGARFGPRALRSDAYEIGSFHHVGAGLDVFEHIETIDYGDAACPRGDVDGALDNIRVRVADLASRGIVPLVIGGDHTITWPWGPPGGATQR
jgi:agmatinase